MSEPWYDGNHYGWLPGALLGCACGLWGAAVGLLATRGKARRLVLGATWAFLAVSAALLAAGLVALAVGQPYGVWYGLTLGGGLGLVVVGANTFTVYWAYRHAEARKMAARDIG